MIQMVLMELPQWLENRPLLLSCRLNLNELSQQLCSLVQQPEEVLKHVRSIAPSSLRTQVANLVYPVRRMAVMCRSRDLNCHSGHETIVPHDYHVTFTVKTCVNLNVTAGHN